ncbi:glycosyltransferase [Methylobacterium sp. Leaf456]|uniref:glycosyltransferase n=1 Tax=Methylobacterium sp. Leaf456 TaxID=1736382 RepID=UPI0009EA9C72|nr:glycosyltransferase [Methylobacterium sp. Leaf456]
MRLPRLFRKRRPVPRRMPGFDEAYYLRAYRDVERFPGTPLQHYLLFGWREGRDPSAGFSGDGYLAANPDVEARDVDPLTHFLDLGLAEGRTGWQKEVGAPAPAAHVPRSRFEGPLRDFVEETMVFMYWVDRGLAEPPSAPDWRAIYPRFEVFGDRDVIPLLPKAFVPVFEAIRLPSAKSDIARLFLLREHGGLYVDAHVGPTSPQNLMETLKDLETVHVVLFGREWAMSKATDLDLMNGVLAARRGASELDRVIDRVVGNVLAQKRKEEATLEYVPYDLFGLTGTFIIVQEFFDQAFPKPRIKAELRERVSVHFMKNNIDSGFGVFTHYSYRKPNEHWSERQSRERFFLD